MHLSVRDRWNELKFNSGVPVAEMRSSGVSGGPHLPLLVLISVPPIVAMMQFSKASDRLLSVCLSIMKEAQKFIVFWVILRSEDPMDMDFRLIVLLLVLTIHCQGVNIGEGNIQAQTIAPAVITEQGRELFPALTKFYTRFTGWRYIPQANDMIKDSYELKTKLSLTKCLKECHQHNQGSATKCIAVNWCAGQGYIGQSEKCQLETDTAEFIANLRKSYSRCILLSTGLVKGENADSIVKKDLK